MGVMHIEGVVTGPTGKRSTVRLLVDSGATYTLLPYEDWRAIELTPKRSVTFTLADGTTVERKVSECHIALSQGEGHTPVILGLVLNPFTRSLQPMRMLPA